MGGEGSMMHALTSLKNNNRRRKQRRPFSKNSLNNHRSEKPVYDFPEATPEVMTKIKLDMVKNQKSERIVSIFIFIIIAILIIFIII
ncbi:hypothetical protein [uncultured Psychroserpens sp.]|uniref:hypothetical protein n=1 Tax=uncultured Psychroserpens sp. TaxID=255436 RepID=UPI00262E6382|nr:hypothetical protein [uncultured Psychroserpens sp.]